MLAVVDVTPDFKPEPRIVDPAALKRAMERNRKQHGGTCWSCRENRASEPHHIIFKSQGGDDLVENVAPLCTDCHILFHRMVGEEFELVARPIGKWFTEDTLVYVMRKKGVGPGQYYLRDKYFRGTPARVVRKVYAEIGDRKTWRDYPGARFR